MGLSGVALPYSARTAYLASARSPFLVRAPKLAQKLAMGMIPLCRTQNPREGCAA